MIKTIVTVAAIATWFLPGDVSGQTFEQKEFALPATEYYSNYNWIDFNADGALDILEKDVYQNGKLHLSSGSGYTASIVPSVNFYYSDPKSAFQDFDGDGDVDILAVENYAIKIAKFELGQFTLHDTGIRFTDPSAGTIYWIDIDGDLDLDIVQGRNIYLNSMGSFVKSRFEIPSTFMKTVWGDMDRDGLVDAVVGYEYEGYEGGEVRVFRNLGEGNFNHTGIALQKSNLLWKSITLLDADSDSDLDVFVNDYYGRGWIFGNSFADNATLTFNSTQIFTQLTCSAAMAGDLNGDGLEDLLLMNAETLDVLKNVSASGNISFTKTSLTHQAGTNSGAELADIDNDNDLDIHVKGYNWVLTNIIFENTGAAASAPTVVTGLASDVKEKVVLSWNDLSGISYNLEVKRNGIIYKPSLTSPSKKLLMRPGTGLVNGGKLSLYNLVAGQYEWRVQAIHPSGVVSDFSSTASFEISAAPTSLTLQALSLKSVKLCWSFSGSPAASFRVFRGDRISASVQIAELPAGTTCYEDSGFPENQLIEYFVVAVNGGIQTAPSNRVVHYSSLFVESLFGTADPNIVTGRCLPGDFDSDGDYDLEFVGGVGHADNNIFFKNDGTGSLSFIGSNLGYQSFSTPYSEPAGPRDIDNDGDLDMIFITSQSYYTNKVVVYVNNNGTFVKGYETPEYFGIYQLAVEDLNNDGRLDLFFSHVRGNHPSNPHAYKLLFQNSNGSFDDSKIAFSEKEPSTLTLFKCADLNSDGFKDILWPSSDYSSTQILVNEGGQAFTRKSSILPLTSFMGVEDYNGDGITDIIVLGNEGLNLYFGAGNFTFNEPKVIPVSYFISSPYITHADIDVNGWPDLLLSDGYNNFVVLNNGNGSLKNSTISFQKNWGSSISITDIENDGDIDIVKTGNDGQHQGINYIYKNQSADINLTNNPPTIPATLSASFEAGKAMFTWTPSSDDRTPAKLLTYNLSIVDSNGKIWLSSETNAAGDFGRIMAPGNAGHATQFTINNLPAGVYSARVQAIDAGFARSPWSGKASLVIPEGPTNLALERILLTKVKLSWKNSSFAETSFVIERKTIQTVWQVIAEVNAGILSYTDADLQLNNIYQYRVYERSANASSAISNVAEWSTHMWVAENTELGSLTGSMDLADFNGDGRMDMVVNGARNISGNPEELTKATYENTLNGWTKRIITPSDLGYNSPIAFVDLNGDSKLDIYHHGYIWNSGYKTEVFMNNGNSTFSASTNFLTEGAYAIESPRDFDMDNDLDLTVLKDGTYPNLRDQYRNDGNGSYVLANSMSCTLCPAFVATADFDKDGDEDGLRVGGNQYALELYSATGPLGTSVSFPAYESRPHVVDYNDDGWPDVILLTTSFYTKGKIYKNLGTTNGDQLQFEELPMKLDSYESSIFSGDFDHDGKTDFALIAPKVSIFLNQGNDTFQQFDVPSLRVSSNNSALIDYDGDGDLDIFLGSTIIEDYGSYSEKAKIILNQTIVSNKGVANVKPDAPTDLLSTQDLQGVHLTWSDPNDDHTPKDGLTYDVVITRAGKMSTKGAHDPSTGRRLRIASGRSTGIATLNNLTPGEYTWRVQAIDGSYAASDFSAQSTFIFLPPPPVLNDTTIYLCGRTATLTAKGTGVQYFKDEAMTQLLASGSFSPLESQTIYVTQTVSGYRSIPKAVQVSIIDKTPVPAAMGSNLLQICESWVGPRTIGAQGENIKWYSDASLKNFIGGGSWLDVQPVTASYYVTQTIQGCESNAQKMDVVKVLIDSKVYLENDKLRASEANADAYIWYRNGSYFTNTMVPYITFDGVEATYQVVIIKGDCQETSQPFLAKEAVTAIEGPENENWTVSPNPATTQIKLRHVKPNVVYTIFDAKGVIILAGQVTLTGEEVIDTGKWPKGLYTIIMGDGDGASAKRFVLY